MRALRWAVVATALTLAACGGGRYMIRTQTPAAIQAPPGAALIVFMRPSNYGGAAVFHVADGQGNLLGDISGRQYFLHAVPPGQHTFIAWGENADMIQANVQAGGIYYALIGVRMGVWSARLSISALTQRREEWPNLLEWLRESTQVVRDERRFAQDPPNPNEIARRIGAAQQAWAGYDQREQGLRVLMPGDGGPPPPL